MNRKEIVNEQPDNPSPFVSVIIPVYNDLINLRKLLASLADQTYPRARYEVIVVDNGSAEDVSKVTDDFDVTLLYENEIQSSYAARNKGIAAARGEVFAFIDSDCKASDGWVAEGIGVLQEMNSDMVGGKVTFAFSDRTRAAEYYDAVNNFQFEEKIKRGTCGGGNTFVKRSVFDKIGMFDPNMKSGGDVVFARKATTSGLKLVYAPRAEVFHPTRSFSQLAKKTFRVGAGKADITKRSNESAGKVKLVQSGSIRSLLSPVVLKKKLDKAEYKVGAFKFLAILMTGYGILFAGFAGLIFGKYLKKTSRTA